MHLRWRKTLHALLLIFAAIGVLENPRHAAAQGAGYWHTDGNLILDANGKVVLIAGINWYGFETADEVVHGLYDQDYKTILKTIYTEGYNTIRLPYSNQMVETPIVPKALANYNSLGPINSDLAGLNSLQIMDKIVSTAGALGLKIILVNHRSEAGNSNEANGLWYTAQYPEAKWIADWQTLVARYKSFTDAKGNPVVIGADLRNEPHLLVGQGRTGSCWTGDTWTNGCPLTNTAQNWPAAAERAAKAILSINPNLLIAVEGTDCYSGDCGWQGANLEGAANYPVQLSVANRLVYSAHDYGPDLDQQSWFTANTTQASLNAVWTKYWAYLSIDKIAPVWLGELGTTNVGSDTTSKVSGSQGQWFSSLVNFLCDEPSINWTYWALNGEDTFGLLDGKYDEIPAEALKQQMLASIQFRLSEAGGGTAPPTCGTIPAIPTGLTAAEGSSSAIQLRWNAVTSPANCTVTYSVYRSTISGFTPAASNAIATGLATVTYLDSTLNGSTTYYYRIVAVDAKGSSAATAQVSGKTAAKVSGLACHIAYTVTGQWSGGFQASIAIENTGSSGISSWTLEWTDPAGTSVTSFWNGVETQSNGAVTVKNESYNAAIPAGGSVTGMGFTASAPGAPTTPASFVLNGATCK